MLFLRLLLLSLVSFLFSSFALHGAETTVPIVESIQLRFENKLQNASDEFVYSNIELNVGAPYDQAAVTQSINALYKTDLFEDIRIKAEPGEKPDAVAVTFLLKARPIIVDVQFCGNHQLSTRRLSKEIETCVGSRLRELQLNQDRIKILEYYNKRGFSEATVEYSISTDEVCGSTSVSFNIHEGGKVKVRKICFLGNEPVAAKCLKAEMKTSPWRVWSIITGSGKYQEDVFREDLVKVRQYLRNQGYLDAQVSWRDVLVEPRSKCRVDLTIPVGLGHRYCVGSVNLEGNTLYASECILPLIKVCKGDVYSPEAIEKTTEGIRDAYGQLGYLDTYVEVDSRPNLETHCIDLIFRIHESEKFYVESIKVTGNDVTKTKVILRELALAPGDVFDSVRMQNSQKRLENTNYFKDVALLPEDTEMPGRRNLLVGIKEGHTGQVQFGVSYDTLEQMTGSIELAENNFDITNFRNRFRGGGQKFQIKGRYGRLSNSIGVSFIEPWVCDRELEWHVSVFRSRTDYESSVYDMQSIGLNTGFRKRLWGLWVGSLYYNIEERDVFNVSEKASDVIKKESGKRTISKIGLGLSYDTRDNFLYATRGVTFDINGEVAGGILQGNTKYSKIEARAGKWVPIFETMEQVISFGVETRTIIPYGKQEIPFFEKFFLGGPYSLRGFAHRDVGPKDSKGEPIGGETLMRFVSEYSIRLMEQLRFAAFYDGGFVNKKHLNWSFKGYSHNWGLGLRIFILGAPLRLDWGFPIRGDGKNDRKRVRFNFSFGTTF